MNPGQNLDNSGDLNKPVDNSTWSTYFGELIPGLHSYTVTETSGVTPTTRIETPFVVEQDKSDIPGPGDTVWSIITGNGPFVIVDRAFITIPLATKANDNKFEATRTEGWIVRNRRGKYLSIPVHEVTKTQPKHGIFLRVIRWFWTLWLARETVKVET